MRNDAETDMQPFKVAWDDAKLARVREQFRAYRLPVEPDHAGWRYGCDAAFLKQLCDYWANELDAQAVAATLNRHPQVLARIDGFDLHAVHVVGEANGRRPLLLTHGWPGSVYEFWHVIGPLAFPSQHGGRRDDAFDLVIPSLPGFGFSGKPTTPIGPRTTAGLFARLMMELGYPRFLAQGGDWGAGVSAWLALDHADRIGAIHLNYLLVQPDAAPETADEIAWKAAFDSRQQALGAYAMLQGTRPQSLAYAMAENPAAQAAWILERFHDWADLSDRPFDQVFSREDLVTNLMIYILNDAFVSATWYYAGAAAEGVRRMPPGRRIEVPTAFAAYPDRRAPAPPRSWVERGYPVSRWIDQPRGGHFAALEVPDLFVSDLRHWARDAI